MYLRSSVKQAFSLLPFLILLTACGGGGGGGSSSFNSAPIVTDTVSESATSYNHDSDPAIEEVTGQFIDGPVAGLTYLCLPSGMSGVTNSNGEFTCQEGNTVTFKVGDVVLGTALADSVITPVSLHPNNTQAAINVARLLQSLDSDDDFTTIEINTGEAARLDATLNVTANTFEEKATTMLKKTLIASDAAVTHMNTNLALLSREPVVLPSEQEPYISYIPDESMRLVEQEPSTPLPSAQPEETVVPAEEQPGFTLTDLIATLPTSSIPVVESPAAPAPSVPTADEPAAPVSDPVVSEPTVPDPAPSSPAAPVTNPVTPEPEPIATEPVQVCQNGPANHEGRVTDSATGEGIAGVEVSVGGCTTTTDAQGFYELPNIAVSDRAAVTFRRNGYSTGSAIIMIEQYLEDTTTISSNYLEYSLGAYNSNENYDSQSDKTLSFSNAAVTLPASIYTDKAGNSYNGMVAGSIIYEDLSTEKGRNAFPGDFAGKSSNNIITSFVSYGLLAISLRDDQDNTLTIENPVTIAFPPASDTTQENIALWYFDYDKGIWIEEGYATRQGDGSYKGTVSHPGTWSLNIAVNNTMATYTGKIVYTDTAPAKDVRVFAIGKNWISSDLSTDADGNFEISVVPDSSFTLKAYNYKDKYEALYEGTIPAIASGETSG